MKKMFKTGLVLFIVNGFAILVGTAMCVLFNKDGDICVGQERKTEEER